MKMSKITCRSEVHKNTFGPNLTSLYTQCNRWHQEHFYCGFQTWFLSNSLSQWQQMWCWVQNPCTEGSRRLLLTAQLTQTHSLAVFKNKDHCSAQQSHQNGSTMLCCCYHWGPCQVASVEMLRGFISLTCSLCPGAASQAVLLLLRCCLCFAGFAGGASPDIQFSCYLNSPNSLLSLHVQPNLTVLTLCPLSLLRPLYVVLGNQQLSG